MINLSKIRGVVSAFVAGVLFTVCGFYGWHTLGQNKTNTACSTSLPTVKDLGLDLSKQISLTEKRSTSKNKTRSNQTKWEHGYLLNIGFANVNNYGEEGWELVDITTYIDNDQLKYVYFFKRAL